MFRNDFETDQAIWNTLGDEERRRQGFAARATPELAQRVGAIHRQFPSLPTGVKLSAAQGNLSDDQVLAIAKSAAPIAGTKRTTPKKGGMFDSLISKLKTASRYTFAAMNFPSEFVQGAAGQMFDNNSSVAGWMISTELGSLIANDEEAGTGFFIGGRAKELQAERARRYRGEIDGSAFTIGRGLASTFLKEDSTAYRLLSGALDAGVAIGVPTVPLAGQIGKAARIAEEAGTAGTTVRAIAEASRTVGKGSKEIGVTRLSAAERDALREQVGLLDDAVDFGKANRFFDTASGRRIIERTAKTKDFAETWDLWGKKLDPDTAKLLTEADTPAKVKAALLDALGTEVTSTSGLPGVKKVHLSLAQRNKMLAQIPAGEGFSRAWAKMPRHNINIFMAESPRDKIDQLDTLDRTLKLFKVAPEARSEYINRMGDLLINKDINQIEKFYDDLGAEAKNSMIRFGTNETIVEQLYESFNKYKEVASRFAMDDLGDQTDFGAYRKIHGLESGVDDVVYLGPQATSEMAKHEFFVPDVKQVRRLTNQYNKLWVVKDKNLQDLRDAGQLRFPLALAEKFQEEIWRKYITATIGNFVRNTVDSTMSIAMSGSTNAVNVIRHPVQWMSLMSGKVGRGTLNANDWDALIMANKAEDAVNDLATATGEILNSHWRDPMVVARRQQKLGVFKGYVRPSNVIDRDVARAHGDEIGRLNFDWATRSMASAVDETGSVRGGMTIDEIIAEIRGGKNLEAKRWFEQQKRAYKNGKPLWNNKTRELSWDSIDLDKGDNLRYVLESTQARLNHVTGGNTTLQNVVHLGYLPDKLTKINTRFIDGEIAVGNRVRYTEFTQAGKKKGIKQKHFGKVVDINERTGEVTIAPYAFVNGENTTALERLLASDSIYFDPKMPTRVVGEVRDAQNLAARNLKERMDIIYNKFHSLLYNQPISKLERAPLFKSFYYGWVDKLSQSLDEQSLNKIIDDITAKSNGNPETYLTPDLWKKLTDLKENPSKLYGTLNAEDVSSYASAAAIDEYLKTVYNAVDRRNSTDVLRLLSPFAQQQAEFWGRMARFGFSPVKGGELGYLPNAKALRKIQLVVEGGRDADPEGDGRGFFYKDQNTGQWMFSFPMSGALTKAVTGVNANLAAPVKGVALALDYHVGMGPLATIAASAILPDIPSLDNVKKFILPYGEKNVTGALTPSWIQKVYDGVAGKDNGKFFANTYAETMQALAATGKYDLSDPNQKDAMLQDAKHKAQILTILRGFTQFTGPAAGDYDFKVMTDQGDVYAAGLAGALQSLRNINYDTATLRFIEIFGEDAFTYLSNKTVSETGGLEGSKEFGVFERNNQGLFRQYKDVAGFFGPVGTDFDFEVYTRQLQTGKRRRLSPEEMVSAAENSIGLAYYRDMKEHLGPVITTQERAYLADYRKKIQEKYRGFGSSAYDPNKTPRQIEALFTASKRGDLANNPVAKALNEYEKIRGLALEEAMNRGYNSLKSDKLTDLHDYVNGYADVLIKEYPEFARVFERVLSQELQ